MIKEQYNKLPRPTFRWMKVNHLELERQEPIAAPVPMQPEERHEGAIDISFCPEKEKMNISDFTGASEASLQEALQHGNTACLIESRAAGESRVWLTYRLSEAVPRIVGQLRIQAAEGSRLCVYLSFEGTVSKGDINLFTYIEAGAGAQVRIAKIQVCEGDVRQVEHRYAKAAEKGSIEYVNAELGGHETVLYYKTDLMEQEGKFLSKAMYLGKDDQIFDFSYWVPQQGVKTHTDILTTGALMDRSKKYFRGTIDFLRGGKKAVGSEADTCLLLSPDVHSVSVPLLLCKEDDVSGNHASSAGQIDKDKLFYLMSRGFSEAGAQMIIVESNIRPVIDELGDEQLENKVLQAVREKMQYCQKKGDCHAKCTKRFPYIN